MFCEIIIEDLFSLEIYQNPATLLYYFLDHFVFEQFVIAVQFLTSKTRALLAAVEMRRF